MLHVCACVGRVPHRLGIQHLRLLVRREVQRRGQLFGGGRTCITRMKRSRGNGKSKKKKRRQRERDVNRPRRASWARGAWQTRPKLVAETCIPSPSKSTDRKRAKGVCTKTFVEKGMWRAGIAVPSVAVAAVNVRVAMRHAMVAAATQTRVPSRGFAGGGASRNAMNVFDRGNSSGEEAYFARFHWTTAMHGLMEAASALCCM